MSNNDKLDIILYNAYNNGDIEKIQEVASEYNTSVECLYERYLWFKKLDIDPNIYHLEENHKLIYEIFKMYSEMLISNDIEHYYTSGILSYLLVNKKLERYHHDLDIFVNMEDIEKLEQICGEYNFSFERKIGNRGDGTKRVMLKMYYKDKVDIPITIFMYVRKEDNSIIQKDYFYDKDGNELVEYIYNSPLISELSFDNNIKEYNGTLYYAITLEAMYLCKNKNRVKDIYDCNIFIDYVDMNKVKELIEAFKVNLPNIVIESKDDLYSSYIFNKLNEKGKVLKLKC